MHPAWNILLQQPAFWRCLSHKNHMCDLRATCREFRSDIPEREVCLWPLAPLLRLKHFPQAILHIFETRHVPRTQLVRILPLTVSDVLSLPAMVSFVHAFRMAETKVGGFENCMAIIRSKPINRQRAKMRQMIRSALGDGWHNSCILDDENISLAVNQSIRRAVRWEYNLLEHQYGRRRHYETIKDLFRRLCGRWYSGISRDSRSAVDTIRWLAAHPDKDVVLHSTITGNARVILLGVIRRK